ncbi:MAG: LacI family DNA-binding transcriptional regulator [Lachnospiraceae bacterium]|nr:LacI family DNA-binding transcriptional regulator [Lachnospiraceae bacterium]
MKVSIKQISELTGFSPATISNALNHKKGVNKETSMEIFKAAKELGYINESSITKIKFVMYKRNGMITEDTPFFSLMIDGFERECRESGYEMVLCYLDRRLPDYEEQVKWLINDTSAAIVLMGAELMEDDIDAFRGVKCPFLTLDYWNSDMSFDGVAINNTDSARMATDFLIKKGHTKIGYLRGAFRIKAFRTRAVGFRIAMNKYNIPVDNQFILTLDTTMDGAYRDMCEILKKKNPLPTAFFADNDMIALGAMKAMQEFGIRIPEDVSVIGFDDLPFCEIASPRLTSLRVPKQEMGQKAVRRIIEMIKNESPVKMKIQICTEFVERDSVRKINSES